MESYFFVFLLVIAIVLIFIACFVRCRVAAQRRAAAVRREQQEAYENDVNAQNGQYGENTSGAPYYNGNYGVNNIPYYATTHEYTGGPGRTINVNVRPTQVGTVLLTAEDAQHLNLNEAPDGITGGVDENGVPAFRPITQYFPQAHVVEYQQNGAGGRTTATATTTSSNNDYYSNAMYNSSVPPQLMPASPYSPGGSSSGGGGAEKDTPYGTATYLPRPPDAPQSTVMLQETAARSTGSAGGGASPRRRSAPQSPQATAPPPPPPSAGGKEERGSPKGQGTPAGKRNSGSSDFSEATVVHFMDDPSGRRKSNPFNDHSR